ncbi:Phosphoesterase family protein [compost metagenome]
MTKTIIPSNYPMKIQFYCFIFLSFVFSVQAQSVKNPWIITSPSWNEITQINKADKTVIPSGRIIKPYGKTVMTAPHPYGLAISKDGTVAVTVNSGIAPISISIIRNALSDTPEVQQVPPGPSSDSGILASSFMGVAISSDNKTVYVSGGKENNIHLFDIKTGQKLASINCAFEDKDNNYKDGYIGDLVLSKDEKKLYAVDQMGFRMLIIDLASKKLIKSVPVGRYPFGITLSPDEKKVYVANVGMYEYKQIPGLEGKNVLKKGLTFPAFAYGSKEAEEGKMIDSLKVPGLGNPLAPEAFSVFAIDISNPEKAFVKAKIKTGFQIGEKIEGIPAVGGASPNSLVATDNYVFVSNGTNDNISVIDSKSDKIITTIFLKPCEQMKNFRGVIPFGLALSPDQKKLYVAEAGINAVGVINLSNFEVEGHIPTAWFPSKIKVSEDGKHLFVTNSKGFGSGPNGGESFQAGPEGSYIGNLMKGSVTIVDVPKADKLEKLTKEVIENNFNIAKSNDEKFDWRKNNPIPLYPSQKESPIKYIVFISKENRTYDEIFGQLKNANGDPSLARFGKNEKFQSSNKKLNANNITIMPNHLDLAAKFAFSDNFYVESDVSADGHRWLVNTYPNEWVETSVPADYGGNRGQSENSKAPGRFGIAGSAGAIYPEDYNEAGSLWEHLERNKIEFYNFGCGVMFEPASYHETYKYSGIKHYVNFPLPKPAFSRTSKMYPTYNTAIPDQFRVDMFQQEFTKKWLNTNDKMPTVLTVIIPNDHGAGDRPEAGYPFHESYMADNDLAVGRIVEFLSHTPYWKNMLIVITEDDAQGGVDHIDAHRSVLMAISPYVKRNYAGHIHYSIASIFKTFWNVLGIPYLNQYDAAANDMADLFSDTPDFTPYNALKSDIRIFNPQKALDPFDEKFDWKSLEESREMDNMEDMINDNKEQEKDRLENREKKMD